MSPEVEAHREVAHGHRRGANHENGKADRPGLAPEEPHRQVREGRVQQVVIRLRVVGELEGERLRHVVQERERLVAAHRPREMVESKRRAGAEHPGQRDEMRALLRAQCRPRLAARTAQEMERRRPDLCHPSDGALPDRRQSGGEGQQHCGGHARGERDPRQALRRERGGVAVEGQTVEPRPPPREGEERAVRGRTSSGRRERSRGDSRLG
jgi:hypothetical protein